MPMMYAMIHANGNSKSPMLPEPNMRDSNTMSFRPRAAANTATTRLKAIT